MRLEGKMKPQKKSYKKFFGNLRKNKGYETITVD
jgi:hypothetical protein